MGGAGRLVVGRLSQARELRHVCRRMQRRALITGITGQDGSYLAELLISKGYEVHGILRRASLFNTDRIDHLYRDPHQAGLPIHLHYGDLTDGTSLRQVLESVQPQEIYNLGAQSHVRVSFQVPEYTAEAVAMGTLRLLEAARDYIERRGHAVRIYRPARRRCTAPPRRHKTRAPRFTRAARMA